MRSDAFIKFDHPHYRKNINGENTLNMERRIIIGTAGRKMAEAETLIY